MAGNDTRKRADCTVPSNIWLCRAVTAKRESTRIAILLKNLFFIVYLFARVLQFQPRARIELNLFVTYLEEQGGCAGNVGCNIGKNVAGIDLVALTDLYIL